MRIAHTTTVRRCSGDSLVGDVAHLFDSLLAESISAGIIFIDDMGLVSYLNRTAEILLDIKGESVLGRRVDTLPLKAPIYRVLSASTPVPVEMNINGRTLLTRSMQVVSGRGGVIGEMFELLDFTTEKNERRRRDEFVAMMTHDLKSPLQVVTGYAQMIRQGVYGDLSEPLIASVDNIERAAMRLAVMIEDMLDSYRLDAGGLRIERMLDELGQLLSGCCLEKLQEARKQGISFRYEIAEDLPLFSFDGKQLSRVFANLLGNAMKFTPRGGRVALEAKHCDGMIVVSVEDSGIGIPSQDLQRVFSKFYRSRSASGFNGTGLGLAISKAIVEAHGGIIEVESEEGRGSRFTVTFPCGEESGCHGIN